MADLTYSVPPSGFPEPSLKLAPIANDEYGTTYADPRGYLWREPRFRARYDQLKQIDPTFFGGWTSVGNWFRTRKQSDEYKPSAAQTVGETIGNVLGGAAEGAGPATDTAFKLGTLVVIGLGLYVAAQLVTARNRI